MRVHPGGPWAFKRRGLPDARAGWGAGAARSPSPAHRVLCHILAGCSTSSAGPFLISLFHPHKPRKSCKVRRNAGICSTPQNRADIVPAFQFSAALILVDHTNGSNQFPGALRCVLRCLLAAFSGQLLSNLESHLPTHPLQLTQKGRLGVKWMCAHICPPTDLRVPLINFNFSMS